MTTSDGVPIAAGATLEFASADLGSIWAISGLAGQNLRLVEVWPLGQGAGVTRSQPKENQMKRKFVSIIVVLGLLLAIPSTASANSQCNPVRGGNFMVREVGWEEYAYSPHFISAVGARLEYLTPGVAIGGETSVRIRLHNQDRYVQVGFISRSSSLRNVFVERGRESTGEWVRWYWTPPAIDALADFQIIFSPDPIPSRFLIYWDSTLIWNSSLHDPTGVVFLPKAASVVAETHSADDQLYGGTWDYEDVDQMRYGVNQGAYQRYGSNPLTFPWLLNDGESWYARWVYENDQPYPTMDLFDWYCY